MVLFLGIVLLICGIIGMVWLFFYVIYCLVKRPKVDWNEQQYYYDAEKAIMESEWIKGEGWVYPAWFKHKYGHNPGYEYMTENE